jgi:multidrug resistance protein, MATE family
MKTFSTHIKETLSLSFPIIIGQLGGILMSAQDNIMIGWVSELHLSASALANSLYVIIFVIGMGLTMAISPLVSESIGAKESEKSGGVLYQGLWAALLMGGVLSLLIESLVWLLPYMKQPPEEVILAIPYLRILNLGTLPMLFFLSCKQFTDGWSNPKMGMYVTFIGLICNFILNYVFIFVLKSDLVGAAWATTISKIVMFLIIWFLIKNNAQYHQILIKNNTNFNKQEVLNILKLGLPIGMQIFFELLAFGGATIMIGWLDNATMARAAHQIAIGTAAITFMCCSGLAIGASVRVGNFLGANEKAEMRQAANAALFLTIILMSFFAVLMFVFRNQIPILYGVTNPQVAQLTATLCIFATAFQIFDGLQVVAAGILRGAQDIRFSTWVISIAYTIVCIPISYVLSFVFGFNVFGFWWGFLITLMLVSVALVWRIYRIIK